MFSILEKIDKAVGTGERFTLVDKSGRHLTGTVTDSWVRISGGKMRGKIRFLADGKGEVEVDANDLLDLKPLSAET